MKCQRLPFFGFLLFCFNFRSFFQLWVNLNQAPLNFPIITTNPMQPDWKLDPTAVRERSLSIVGCREIPSGQDTIISFLVGVDKQDINALARVNVFVDSGTIATCRVLCGKARQTFRRNVRELDVVERLLKHPEQYIAIDECLVGTTDEDVSTTPSPKRFEQELELLDVGHCILLGEVEKLQRHLDSIVVVPTNPNKKNEKYDNYPEEEEDDDESASSTKEEEGEEDGMEFQFNLPANVMTQVDQCLKDISKMNKLVKVTATNGRGTIFIYGNGGVAYTPSIPKALCQTLRNLRKSSFSSRPNYVALGTRDRYYVTFNDGTADWKGPKQLDKILKKCHYPNDSSVSPLPPLPRSVAFGSTYDTFFIVFHDGSWEYQGRGIPDSLKQKLRDRDNRDDLVLVNLGPLDEWFIKARNGRMWWNGGSNDLEEAITDILEDGKYIHTIDFGENESFFLSFHD